MKGCRIILLAILFVSCSTTDKRAEHYQFQIYNIALDETVGDDSVYRRHQKIPPYFYLPSDNGFDSSEFREHRRWSDSLQAILDTATLFVVVSSKLDSFLATDLGDDWQKLILSDNIGRSDLDSFRYLVEGRAYTGVGVDTVDIDRLVTKYSYKIIKKGSDPDDAVRNVGLVSFSSILFNSDQSYAVLSSSYICGRLCGNGRVFFLKRINDRWVLLNVFDTWVS